MKLKRHFALGATVLTLAIAFAAIGGAGIGVGQDGYVGGISVSPSTGACIGGTVTISGSGVPANTTVKVYMANGPTGEPANYYAATMGTTMSDAAGNWALVTTVPTTVIRGTGDTVSTFGGTWGVVAYTEYEEGGYWAGTNITLLECYPSTLPSTGNPAAIISLLGGGLLAAGGLSLRAWRSRRRS